MYLTDPAQFLAMVQSAIAAQAATLPRIDVSPGEQQRFRVVVILGNRRATYREMLYADPSALADRILRDFGIGPAPENGAGH